MKNYFTAISKKWFKLFLPVGILIISACSMNPIEDSKRQYTSHYDRSTHVIDGFDIRSKTAAPEQITLMFRIDVEPKEAFELVSDFEKLATWFSGIKNPALDNTHSIRGPNEIGVGSVRSCSLDGAFLYEDIVHYDGNKLSYAYSINMDKSTVSFPISDTLSLFTVESDGNGGSLISWRHYYEKNFHIVAPVITFMMKTVILKPAVENLFDQYGGEWVEPNQA